MEYQSYFDIPVATLKRKVPTDELDAGLPSTKRAKMTRRFSLESMTAVEEIEGSLAGRRHGQQKCDDYDWIPTADPYEWLPDLDDDTDGNEKIVESMEEWSMIGSATDPDTEDAGIQLDMLAFETQSEVNLEDLPSYDLLDDLLLGMVDDLLADPAVELCTDTNDGGKSESEDAMVVPGNDPDCAGDDQLAYPEQFVSINERASAPAVRIGTLGRSRILGNTIAYRRAMRAYGIQASYARALDMSRVTGLRKEEEAMTLRQPYLFCIRQENLERVVDLIEFAGYSYHNYGVQNQDGFLDVVVWLPWVAGQPEDWVRMQEHMSWASQGGSIWNSALDFERSIVS